MKRYGIVMDREPDEESTCFDPNKPLQIIYGYASSIEHPELYDWEARLKPGITKREGEPIYEGEVLYLIPTRKQKEADPK